MKKIINNGRIIILLCFTLGLAPFFPEPHIFGKLKWLAGGGNGMVAQDYFDVLIHGFPFVLLIRLILLKFNKRKTITK
jgi:hypothetical protein